MHTFKINGFSQKKEKYKKLALAKFSTKSSLQSIDKNETK